MTYELTTDDVKGIFLAGALCMGENGSEAEEDFDRWLSEMMVRKNWEIGFETGFAAASAEIPGYMEE